MIRLNLRRLGILGLLVPVLGLCWWILRSPPPFTGNGTVSNDPGAIELGRRLYQQGLLPSGRTLVGSLTGNGRLTGEQASCATCHRPSAMGSSEGETVVPALRGEVLFVDLRLPTSKPPQTPVLRPAYSMESLRRAVRDGIAADGEALSALMPRYALTDEQIDYLVAYLRNLSMDADPGVDDTNIHFATVVGETVDPAARKAMLDVFDRFFRLKNSESRHETQRAAHAPWHKAWTMESYRRWVLHVWELKGPEHTWSAQIEQHYWNQPVFAVLNGLVDGEWRPLHEFCENHEVPCLFPTTDLPVVEAKGHFVFYLDQGMRGQGKAVAEHLSHGLEPGATIVQYYRAGDRRGETAAAGFRSQIQPFGAHVTDHTVEEPVDPGSLIPPGAIAVFWLSESDLQPFWRKIAGNAPARIYLSTTLSGIRFETVPVALREKVFFVHPYAMPDEMPRQLVRLNAWLRMNKIADPGQQRIQANAYFTLSQTGMALKRIRGYWFRDYLLEGIEHLIDNAVFTSVYPRMSLAPGQRFVTKGMYVVKAGDRKNLVSDSAIEFLRYRW